MKFLHADITYDMYDRIQAHEHARAHILGDSGTLSRGVNVCAHVRACACKPGVMQTGASRVGFMHLYVTYNIRPVYMSRVGTSCLF